jgi:outer membrane protein assembly factor BamB
MEDLDLGSGGLLLMPGTTLAFSGGKAGKVYLVDRDSLGGLSAIDSDTNVLQSFQVTSDQVHGGAVWWDGPSASYAYLWPASVSLQQYVFNPVLSLFTLPAFAESPTAAPAGQPGGILALSANGSTPGSAILWAVHQLSGDANQAVRPGILHAYDAEDVSRELWNSEQLPGRDAVGKFAKFVPPTVANGKVYLATFSGQLNVYGLLPVILGIALQGDQVELSWSTGILQSSGQAAGPYTNIVGALSPFPVPLSSGAQFFRVQIQ